MVDTELIKEEINKQLIAEIKSGSQKDVKHNLKTFYKLIQTIKEPLTNLTKINERKGTNENVKGKGKEEDKYIKQLEGTEGILGKNGKLEEFGNEYKKITGIYTKYKKYLKEKKYSAILSDFLYYEQNVLQEFEYYQTLIKPYDDKKIETLYKDSLVKLKEMYTINSSTKNKEEIINKSKTAIDEFLSEILKYLTKNKKNIMIKDRKKIHNKYIRGLYEKIPTQFEKLKENIIKKLTSLTSTNKNYEKKDRNKAAEYYRSIIKALFMIMEKYYYYDLKYKHKFSYQTLNNSYKKNKIGTWKHFKRGFSRIGQSITPLGEYKSKVWLGRKYRINPTFGFKKGTSKGTEKELFSYNIKDLEKRKTQLENQIKEYQGYFDNYHTTKEKQKKLGDIDIGPKSKDTHFEYYEVKKRLAIEIRKLKIIKFFLLRKTVRLKQRTFSERPKLTNTINSLRAKIISRTPKIFKNTKQNKRKGITNALSNLTSKTKINTARNSIKKIFKEIGVTKFRKNKKKKTLKRLKKLSKMVQAEELISNIDTKLEDYRKQNNDKSKQIKNEININKSDINTKSRKEAKNYTVLKEELKKLGTGSNIKIMDSETIKLKEYLKRENETIKKALEYLRKLNEENIDKLKKPDNTLEDYQTYANQQVFITKEAKDITKDLNRLTRDKINSIKDLPKPETENFMKATDDANKVADAAITAATAAEALAASATAAAATKGPPIPVIRSKPAIAKAATEIGKAIAKIETAIKALDTLINKIGIK
jgi:hypothetical protein